jgi:hypothetical protein
LTNRMIVGSGPRRAKFVSILSPADFTLYPNELLAPLPAGPKALQRPSMSLLKHVIIVLIWLVSLHEVLP